MSLLDSHAIGHQNGEVNGGDIRTIIISTHVLKRRGGGTFAGENDVAARPPDSGRSAEGDQQRSNP
jgi:hypothetical protein